MGRLGTSQLLHTAEKAREATAKARDRSEKRRTAKKPAPSFDNLCDPDDGQTPSDVLNSTQVQGWFRDSLLEKFGDAFIVAPWTRQQQKLAKDLLGIYGGELVRKAVGFFVESWDAMVEGSNGRLSGVPSINLLYVMRGRIFGDVQTGKKPPRKNDRRRVSEHRGPREKGRGIGW